MSQVTIYHNPRCSKARQTLELIEARGITPKVIRYLEEPPDRATLKALLSKLSMQPRQLLRSKLPVTTTRYRTTFLRRIRLRPELAR